MHVAEHQVTITLDTIALHAVLGMKAAPDLEPILLTSAAIRIRHGKDVKLVVAGPDMHQPDRQPLDLLAAARAARDAVLSQPHASIKETAIRIGQCRTRLVRLVRLSWLSPEIVGAIVDGRHPATLTPQTPLTAPLPLDWTEQKALLGFA